jgi:hypothetical protein
MTEVVDHGHSSIFHPGTMVPTYPRGIGSAFHGACGAGRGCIAFFTLCSMLFAPCVLLA